MLRRSLIALAGAVLLSAPASAQSPKTLRVVMHSDLKILDPVWTTAYIVRNHGYLIYDTLFAIDGKFEPQPQMVESWTVSDDKLTWTFKLRDGLKWHDGTPVTSADVDTLDQALDREGCAGRPARQVDPGDEGGRRAHLPDRAEGAVRHDAEGARQVGLGAAVRHAQARRRDAGGAADLRHHRLGALHLQEGRMEGRREGRLCPQSRLQAARRAAVRPGRRQGRQARPHRMALDPRSADRGQCPAVGRDRHDRNGGARPLAGAGEGQERQDRRPRSVGPDLRAALQLEAAAVQRRALPPRRDALAQPEGLPAGGDRRSPLLQGMQGDVRLRHAARDLGRHAGPAGIALRGIAQAPEGAGLRRHADRRAADQRQPDAHQPRTGHQDPARARRLQGRRAVDGLADPGGAARQEGSRGAGRLEHRPDRGGGRAAARSGQQPLCRGERRSLPVRLAARRGDREAPDAVHPRGRSQEAARDRREGPDAHPRAKASPSRSASSSNRWRGATP